MGEDELIAHYFAPLAGPGGLGLRDDAALLAPPAGCELVVTCDAVVAGVHFFPDDPPDAIARKALRVNLSDLAAKGADPLGFLLALALPDGWTPDWLAAFAQGLGDDARAYACPLLGGDTVRTPGPLTVSITAMGAVPAGRMVRRTTARPGDLLYVTGTIGDAALGLQVRQGRLGAPSEGRAHLLDRYLLPRPRNTLAPALRAHASAAMDVSDGLIGDCTKLLRASGVGGCIELARVPLSLAARAAIARDPALLETALTGGDDYEVLCAVPPDRAAAIEAMAVGFGVAATLVGVVEADTAPLTLRDIGGKRLTFSQSSFEHF